MTWADLFRRALAAWRLRRWVAPPCCVECGWPDAGGLTRAGWCLECSEMHADVAAFELQKAADDKEKRLVESKAVHREIWVLANAVQTAERVISSEPGRPITVRPRHAGRESWEDVNELYPH